jgi:hypothetical protein
MTDMNTTRTVAAWRLDPAGVPDDATAIGVAALVGTRIDEDGSSPMGPIVEVVMPAETTQISAVAAEILAAHLRRAAHAARRAAEGDQS